MKALVLCFALNSVVSIVSACTTIVVGKDATVDGSVLCSHSNDGEGDTDPRLVLIPASTWKNDTMRPVYYSPESFPRYVGTARANSSSRVPPYEPERGDNGATPFEPICEIPQVPHTYQYLEETYGSLNEKQLGIAESTCSGVFGAAPKGIYYPNYGVGKACFSIDALTQIAMDRHHTAKEAIVEIGHLAEEYGFYGAGLFEGTAESLLITDTTSAWVFHILPDPSGRSSIWAAQRVPDHSFAVVPNVFIIRDIHTESDDFLYSDSVFTVARELNWWSGSGPLDFTAVYSDGEYAHKYYSGRRSWGVFHLFAPSLQLSPNYTEWRLSNPYPFSAQPDKKISVQDVADAMRSFYEGTEFSQAGETARMRLAGGPWQSPDHVAGGNRTSGVSGNWERTIGLYRSSDSYIAQSRGWLEEGGAVLWYGAYAAPYTTYVPFAAEMKTLPPATLGHHMRLDKQTLFWAHRFLGNYVQLKWTSMMEEVISFQREQMNKNLGLQAHVDRLLMEKTFNRVDVYDLYSYNAWMVVHQIWELNDHLMFKYADGQIHSTPTGLATHTDVRQYSSTGATTLDAGIVDKPGYPDDWLEAVGFTDGPPPPPDCAELQWKCGHPDSSSLRQGNEMTTLWRDYLLARQRSACAFSKGDVAAAAGGCRYDSTKGDMLASQDDSIQPS